MIVRDNNQYALLSSKGKVLGRGTVRQLQKRERQIRFFKNLASRAVSGAEPFVTLTSQRVRQTWHRYKSHNTRRAQKKVRAT